MQRKNGLDGYFTVELAMLLPFVFMVILFVMYTLYYWHDLAMMEMDTAQILLYAAQKDTDPEEMTGEMENAARERYRSDNIWLTFIYAKFRTNQQSIEAEVKNRFSFQGRELAVDRKYQIKRRNPVDTLRWMLRLQEDDHE